MRRMGKKGRTPALAAADSKTDQIVREGGVMVLVRTVRWVAADESMVLVELGSTGLMGRLQVLDPII